MRVWRRFWWSWSRLSSGAALSPRPVAFNPSFYWPRPRPFPTPRGLGVLPPRLPPDPARSRAPSPVPARSVLRPRSRRSAASGLGSFCWADRGSCGAGLSPAPESSPGSQILCGSGEVEEMFRDPCSVAWAASLPYRVPGKRVGLEQGHLCPPAPPRPSFRGTPGRRSYPTPTATLGSGPGRWGAGRDRREADSCSGWAKMEPQPIQKKQMGVSSHPVPRGVPEGSGETLNGGVGEAPGVP